MKSTKAFAVVFVWGVFRFNLCLNIKIIYIGIWKLNTNKYWLKTFGWFAFAWLLFSFFRGSFPGDEHNFINSIQLTHQVFINFADFACLYGKDFINYCVDKLKSNAPYIEGITSFLHLCCSASFKMLLINKSQEIRSSVIVTNYVQP